MNRLFLLILLAVPDAHGQPAWYSSEWARIKARMGPIDFDGRLSMSFSLHRIEADGIAWDVSLDHTVDLDAYDAPSSRWIIPGMMCCLAPEGRTSLRALLPNGRILHFIGRTDESAPTIDKGKNWLLYREAQRSIIKSPLGNRYFFFRGQLTEIVTYRGRDLRVVAEAGHIRSIMSGDAPSRAIVSCEYDSIWEPVMIRFGDHDVHRFKWDNGLLLRWDAGVGEGTRFEYRNRMLARVLAPKQPVLGIGWATIPDWSRWSDIWWSPIRVARVNNLAFAYDLGHEGDKFTVTDTTTGIKTVTTFNWLLGLISQRVGDDEPVIVRYSSALVRPGYFISVRLSKGRILEEYEYGADKRLIKINKSSADGREIQVAGREKIAAGWDGEEQPGLPIYEK